MKIKEFEKAVNDLNALVDSLSETKFLTPADIETFKRCKQVIEKHYKFLTGQSETVVLPWDHPQFSEKWQEWKDYKKVEFGFKFKSAKSEQTQLKDLCELSKGDMREAIALIDYAMKKTWRSFFPIPVKEKQKTSDTYKSNIAQRLINR